MRRWLLVVCLFLLASTSRADAWRGTWHIAQGEHRLQLDLTREHSHMGHIDAADLHGVSPDQMNATTETAVHFQMVAEAGTFDLSGSFLHCDSVGRFTFTPDPAYTSRLRSFGVEAGELTDERLYSLAVLDVFSSFIFAICRPTIWSRCAFMACRRSSSASSPRPAYDSRSRSSSRCASTASTRTS